MKTHKFARKPFYVDAVRVSEANISEVASWCEGEVVCGEDAEMFVKVKVYRPLTDRQTQAYIGDWVLFAGTGFKVYTPKAFDKSFEKVKTLTKAQADEAGIRVPHEKRPPKKRVPSDPRMSFEIPKTEEEAAKARSVMVEWDIDTNRPMSETLKLEAEQKEADALIAEVLSDEPA